MPGRGARQPGADTGSATYCRAVAEGLGCFISDTDITTVPSHMSLCPLARCAPRALRPGTQPVV